jgi:calpain-15
MQGSLGDCYFLSSVASLISIHPELVSEKFLFRENPANYFVFKLFINGEWKYLETDDRFPSIDGKKPCFARPHNKKIWTMLLEKFWAKHFESYDRIAAGYASEGFSALTGAPVE